MMRRCPTTLAAIAAALALTTQATPARCRVDHHERRAGFPRRPACGRPPGLDAPGRPAARQSRLHRAGHALDRQPKDGNPLLVDKANSVGFDPTGVVDLLSKDNKQFGLSFCGTGIAAGGKLAYSLNVDKWLSGLPISRPSAGIDDTLGAPPPVTLPPTTPTRPRPHHRPTPPPSPTPPRPTTNPTATDRQDPRAGLAVPLDGHGGHSASSMPVGDATHPARLTGRRASEPVQSRSFRAPDTDTDTDQARRAGFLLAAGGRAVMIDSVGHPRPGRTALADDPFGAGMVGLGAVAGCRLQGAERIVCVVPTGPVAEGPPSIMTARPPAAKGKPARRAPYPYHRARDLSRVRTPPLQAGRLSRRRRRAWRRPRPPRVVQRKSERGSGVLATGSGSGRTSGSGSGRSSGGVGSVGGGVVVVVGGGG